jgi:hypothetical protein
MTPKPQPRGGFTTVRRWHRYRFDVPVQVVLRRNPGDRGFAVRGTAINEGGIALDLDTPLQVGNQVQVEFRPPYAALPVRMRGVVRNVTGNRYGVEFLAADPGEQQEVGLFRQMLRAAADRLAE